MERTYWHKQTASNPLFPHLLWSRPENKKHAGKLLIIGGNLHSFAAPAQAYACAQKAGAGSIRIILPDATQKTVGKIFPEAFFAPSTPSGSFAKGALAEILEQTACADGILVAGDLGRNSETAMLLESLLQKYQEQITLVKDSADYVITSPNSVRKRNSTTLVLTLAQLQRLVTALKWPKHISFDMPLLQLVELLHELTREHSLDIITKQNDTLIVAVNGLVSTTKTATDVDEFWRIEKASSAAVWWLQNPDKTFEALTTSVSKQ